MLFCCWELHAFTDICPCMTTDDNNVFACFNDTQRCNTSLTQMIICVHTPLKVLFFFLFFFHFSSMKHNRYNATFNLIENHLACAWNGKYFATLSWRYIIYLQQALTMHLCSQYYQIYHAEIQECLPTFYYIVQTFSCIFQLL